MVVKLKSGACPKRSSVQTWYNSARLKLEIMLYQLILKLPSECTFPTINSAVLVEASYYRDRFPTNRIASAAQLKRSR
jgi:hypothetical protein